MRSLLLQKHGFPPYVGPHCVCQISPPLYDQTKNKLVCAIEQCTRDSIVIFCICPCLLGHKLRFHLFFVRWKSAVEKHNESYRGKQRDKTFGIFGRAVCMGLGFVPGIYPWFTRQKVSFGFSAMVNHPVVVAKGSIPKLGSTFWHAH